MAHRADLARQRQLMRAKPTKAQNVRRDEGVAVALVVRQVLQRQLRGDAAEFVRASSKQALFQQLAQVAQHAHELREQQQASAAAYQVELQRADERIHLLSGRIIEQESREQANAIQREELSHRLQTTSAEYSDVVDALRKYEEKWTETQTTMAQQRQLLQEMSRSLNERTEQVNTRGQELSDCRECFASVQRENTDLKNQLQVFQIESERAQKQLADERRENKALLWELQTKARDHDDVASQLDDAKTRITTLEGQIQMELITRKSLVNERDAVQLLHRREREEWKNAEEARGETDRHKASEYRSLDLEVRELKQALGRLRSELETERVQREKAENTALRATDIADELKANGKSLQLQVNTLSTELRDERAARESKEGALIVAYREIQSLQTQLREEESARQEAQGKAEALSHRMKLIRRDHLAMLQRVETPPQQVQRWTEPSPSA